MRNRTSDLRIPPFDAVPLSNRDSMVSEVHYEVQIRQASCILLGSAMLHWNRDTLFCVTFYHTSPSRSQYFETKAIILGLSFSLQTQHNHSSAKPGWELSYRIPKAVHPLLVISPIWARRVKQIFKPVEQSSKKEILHKGNFIGYCVKRNTLSSTLKENSTHRKLTSRIFFLRASPTMKSRACVSTQFSVIVRHVIYCIDVVICFFKCTNTKSLLQKRKGFITLWATMC